MYRAHVAAQCQKNPCLSSLERFLSSPKPSQNRCRVSSIDFTSNHDGEIHSSFDSLQAEDLKWAISPVKQPSDLKGRILIVEDISHDVIELLGSTLDIDPFFFAEHVYTPYRDISMQTPNLAVLPSRCQHQRYFNTHYHRTVELPRQYDYLRDVHIVRGTNISRKLTVLPTTHNTSIGLVQHALSVHLFTREQNWLCLILADTSMPNGRLWLRVGEEGDRGLITALNIDSKLFLGGYEDFLNPPCPYTASKVTLEPPSRHGMLEDLIYYWNREWPVSFDPASPMLLSLCFYPLKIIAAEWVNVLAVMNYHMKRYEYNIEGQRTIAEDLDRLNTDLSSLQRWRRRNLSSQQKIGSIKRFVAAQITYKAGPQDASTSDCLLEDFDHLTNSLDFYSQRLESTLPVVMSLVQISDSRRSLAEAANISRLTYLAFVFIPLSFTSSLFSMSGDNAPGGSHFWVYWVVALPMTAAAFLFVRPPRLLQLWLRARISWLITKI